ATLFEHVLRRKRIGLEILIARRRLLERRDGQQPADDWRRLNQARDRVIRLQLRSLRTDQRERDELDDAIAEARALETDAMRTIPSLRFDALLTGMSCAEVAAALRPSSVLVEFVRMRARHPFDGNVAKGGESRGEHNHYLAFVLAAGDTA